MNEIPSQINWGEKKVRIELGQTAAGVFGTLCRVAPVGRSMVRLGQGATRRDDEHRPGETNAPGQPADQRTSQKLGHDRSPKLAAPVVGTLIPQNPAPHVSENQLRSGSGLGEQDQERNQQREQRDGFGQCEAQNADREHRGA